MPGGKWTIRGLLEMAGEVAQRRGHWLCRWEAGERSDGSAYAYAFCRRCGAAVSVETDPENVRTVIGGQTIERPAANIMGGVITAGCR